jgi:N-acetylmuramoyl-L-alanine amidase
MNWFEHLREAAMNRLISWETAGLPQHGYLPENSLEVKEEPVSPMSRYFWIIDPGHGAFTKGRISRPFNDFIFREWENTRLLGNLISTELGRAKIPHFITTPEPHIGDALYTRVQRAEKVDTLGLPPLFISLHFNAAGSSNEWKDEASGIETWYHRTSAVGPLMASVFQRHLITETDGLFKDRGIVAKADKTKSFYVLRKTSMPAILIEAGFFTSRRDLQVFQDHGLEIVADPIVSAIMDIEQNNFVGEPLYAKHSFRK